MLSFIALIWGVLAVIGMVIGFIPGLRLVGWVDLPFAILGAVVGIVSIFRPPQGGNRSSITGTTLCMIASIAGMILLVMGGDS